MGLLHELECSGKQMDFVLRYIENHPLCNAKEIETAYMKEIDADSHHDLYDRINDMYLDDIYQITRTKSDKGKWLYKTLPILDQVHPNVSRVIDNDNGTITVKLKDISLELAPCDVYDAIEFVLRQHNMNGDKHFNMTMYYSNRTYNSQVHYEGDFKTIMNKVSVAHDKELDSNTHFGEKLLKIYRVDISQDHL